MSLIKLYENACLDSYSYKDFYETFSYDNIRADYNHNLKLKVNSDEYYLTETALSQLCSKLEVPYAFLNKQPLDFQSMVINELLKRNYKSKKALFRTTDNYIRAILSDKYTQFDNHELLEVLCDKLHNEYHIEHTLTHYGDLLSIRISLFENEVKEKDSVYRLGLYISNSETGLHSLVIRGYLLRLVCTNGLMTKEEYGLKKYHIGIDKSNMVYQIEQAVDESKSKSLELLRNLIQSKNIEINQPYKVLENMLLKAGFSKSYVKDTQLALSEVEISKSSLFDVVNSLTDTAKSLQEPYRATVEGLAGSMLYNYRRY